MIGFFPGFVEEGHVELWGAILVVFFIYDGVYAAEIAGVLILLGEFIVEPKIDWLVCVEGAFHNGRIFISINEIYEVNL